MVSSIHSAFVWGWGVYGSKLNIAGNKSEPTPTLCGTHVSVGPNESDGVSSVKKQSGRGVG
jgi:hypothetical protein